MAQGAVTGVVTSINRSDNSVQVRLEGYQDDRSQIPDDKLSWYKCVSQLHSGIQGATGTHMYYVGSRVVLQAVGTQLMVVGSVTGYDNHGDRKSGGDQSEDETPNIPRQVRGTQGPSGVKTGEGSDQTSKGSRDVQKTDKPYQDENQEKVNDYSRGTAPFDKGKPIQFGDLKSIGIQSLVKGSDVLGVIDSMDSNLSGAIRAATRIIRDLRNNGFGSVSSICGGSTDQGADQVASDFGGVLWEELIQAVVRLLAQDDLVSAATKNTDPATLYDVPGSLGYVVFDVDQNLIDQVSALITTLGLVRTDAQVLALQSTFRSGFSQAATSTITYVSSIVASAGTGAILSSGSGDRLIELVTNLVTLADKAGIDQRAVEQIGGGIVGTILNKGPNTDLSQGNQNPSFGGFGSMQQMMKMMNVFRGDAQAMGEILSGKASLDESLTGIVMKYAKKIQNQDQRGFTR
jgi:hypothetical protein